MRELAEVQSTQEVQFKGLEHPITLHDIAGIRGQYAISLPIKTPETVVPLATPLPFQCFSIDGKTVSDQAIAGQITHLADTSAEAVIASPVALHSNLMLRLLPTDEPEISEVYAKVISHLEPPGEPVSQEGQPRIRLGLTSVPDTAQRLWTGNAPPCLRDLYNLCYTPLNFCSIAILFIGSVILQREVHNAISVP